MKPTGAKCDACPLKGKAMVGSYGEKNNPRLILVGEGPGSHEAFVSKKPFTGPSGDVVRKVLQSKGINPDQCFWTNTTLCLPDDNKEAALAEAQVACQERLRFALQQVKGDAPVIALGKWARITLGLSTTDRWETEALTGRPAIAIPHPSAILHDPTDAPYFIHGMAKALSFTGIPDIQKPTYTVVRNVHYLPTLDMQFRMLADRVVFDFELDDENKVEGKPFLLGLGSCRDGQVTQIFILTKDVLDHADFGPWLRNFFVEYGNKLWGHNAKFDAFVASWNWDTATTHAGDTMIAADVYQPGWYQGLKDLSTYFFNIDDYGERLVKSWLKENFKKPKDRTYDRVPEERIHEYLANDILYTGKLSYVLEGKLRQVGRWERPYLAEVETSNVLCSMERAGLGIDEPYLDDMITWMQGIVAERRQKVIDLSNEQVVNPASPIQVSKYLWGVLKPPAHRARGKAPGSTEEAVLLDIINQGYSHPFVDALREFRRVYKLLTSYLLNVKEFVQKHSGSTPTVHTTFKQTRVISGRLSAVEPAVQTIVKENPNKDGDMNFGQRVKNMYIPTQPGYCLVGVDGNQWELRVAAVWSEDPFLLGNYAAGIDVHSTACDMIFGEGLWNDNHRTKEKNVMFGLVYGGTLEALIAETGLPAQQVGRVYSFFTGKMRRLLDWRLEMLAQAKKGYIISPYFNQYFDFQFKAALGDHELMKIAVNYPVQGTASKITMLAASIALPKLHALGGRLLITVHDNLTGEVPEQHAEQGQAILREAMIEAGTRFYPDMQWKAKTAQALKWGELKA